MQKWRPEGSAMTFDEVSMERSKSFVKALQELKNLRPQLYSAAEYCEKSYLHSEQKQIVLDNLKDYTVRALVNAVDHLGTVAYKLTDLFEQQTLDISTVELKVSCLNQKILTYQSFTDKEGLKQQQMFATNPRHHKHYILPNSISRRVQSSSQLQTDANSNRVQAKPRPQGTPASKTLSWLLASESNSASDETSQEASGNGDSVSARVTPEVFHLLDVENSTSPMPLSTHLRLPGGNPTSNMVLHRFGVKDPSEVSKPSTAFSSFNNIGRHEISQRPLRSKSMLAVFFPKNKSIKPKKAAVA